MSADFDAAFVALRQVFAGEIKHLVVVRDSDKEYMLNTHGTSPYPQHKGEPMYFGSVKRGKAYVSLHFFPLYLNPALGEGMSPELKKRKQGLTCFNFKAAPDAAQLKELKALTKAGMKDFRARKLA